MKFWGTSPTQIWGVGRKGSIYYYNGLDWQQLVKATSFNIFDIWGAYNAKKGEHEILAVASSENRLEGAILTIKNSSVSLIPKNPINSKLYSVWFVPNRHYYVVGGEVHEKNNLSETEWKPLDNTNIVTTGIKGTALNDVFIVGVRSEILHFNGVSWHTYFNNGAGFDGYFSEIEIKGDQIIAVGSMGYQACVARGKRMPKNHVR